MANGNTQGGLSILAGAPRDDDLEEKVDPARGLLGILAAPHTTTPEAQERSRGILDKYGESPTRGRQQEVLEDMQETAESSRQALRDARARILGKPAYDDRQKWLNFAAAMSRPTRTGSFGESLGFGAESLSQSMAERRAAEDHREKQLMGLDASMANIDRGVQASEMSLLNLQQKSETDLAKEALKTLGKSVGKPPVRTPRQNISDKAAVALDKNYAKEYDRWTSTGRSDAAKALKELAEARRVMDTSDAVSGPIVGLMPKGMRDIVLPKSGNVQDLIENTVQRSLRETLGAQFAQKEGEMLLARAYNPRFEEAVNKRKVKRLMDMVLEVAQEKDRKAQHWETQGSLLGYRPQRLYDFDEWAKEIDSIGIEEVTYKLPTGERIKGPSGLTQDQIRDLYREETGTEPKFAEGGEVDFDETGPEGDLVNPEIPLAPAAIAGGMAAGTGIEALRAGVEGMQQRPERLVEGSMDGSIDETLAGLVARQDAGLPGTLSTEGGPGTRALHEDAIVQGGDPAVEALDELDERVGGARERVKERVVTGLRASPYFEQETELADSLYENARPLYKEAYEKHAGISENQVPALRRIMATPDGKKAVGIALRLLKNQGKAIGRADAIGMVHKPSLEFLDLVKRGFDQLIMKEEDKKPTPLGRSMRQLRTSLRDQLDEVAPEYKLARATYAGDLEVLTALRDGRTQFNKIQPPELEQIFGEFSEAEKEAYRSGVAQRFLEDIDRPASDINPAQKVIGSPVNVKRLEVLFPEPREFELFQEALNAESRMFTQEKGMRRRAERRRGQQQSGGKGVIEQGLELKGSGPVRYVLNMLSKKPALTEKEADEVLGILQERDAAKLKARFDQRPRKKKLGKTKAGLIGAGVGALASELVED